MLVLLELAPTIARGPESITSLCLLDCENCHGSVPFLHVIGSKTTPRLEGRGRTRFVTLMTVLQGNEFASEVGRARPVLDDMLHITHSASMKGLSSGFCHVVSLGVKRLEDDPDA
jgi:hypothetical protein